MDSRTLVLLPVVLLMLGGGVLTAALRAEAGCPSCFQTEYTDCDDLTWSCAEHPFNKEWRSLDNVTRCTCEFGSSVGPVECTEGVDDDVWCLTEFQCDANCGNCQPTGEPALLWRYCQTGAIYCS